MQDPAKSLSWLLAPLPLVIHAPRDWAPISDAIRTRRPDQCVIDVGGIYLVRSPPELWVREISHAGAYFIWR